MKGPICGVENCRSRNYEEGEDGFLYCQNGHRQHGLVRGEDDEDNFMNATRVVTRKQKVDQDEDQKVAKHFSGRLAFDLYLKCLQLLLRHQVWFLVKEQGFPAELEPIVFDLWALRIARFGDKIAGTHEQSESQSSSQAFSTLASEDSDATDDDTHRRKSRKVRSSQTLAKEPNLSDCLALCYLGILTLRLPTTPGDFYKWIIDGKLLYNGAIKVLPLAMRDRLPPVYHAVLDPTTNFKFKKFYAAVTDLQISYEHDHGIVWPALNVPLLLFRCVKELALPLQIYDTVTRLANLLGYDFVFHHGGKKTIGVRDLPEAQLIGCLIVSVKLLYPLDDTARQRKIATEPMAIFMDWDEWRHQMRKVKDEHRGETDRYTSEELMELSEHEVFTMQDNQMDQYLDFYGDTFLDPAVIQRTTDNDDFRRALYQMFPLGGEGHHHKAVQLSRVPPLQKKLDKVKAVQNVMKMTPVQRDEDDLEETGPIVFSGRRYASWRQKEEIPENGRVLYEEAARLIGLSMDMLILVVCSIEAKIERWRRQQIQIQAASDVHEDT
ncbi:hypothetical protein ACN47E_003457 [Coniothyrium glycines]